MLLIDEKIDCRLVGTPLCQKYNTQLPPANGEVQAEEGGGVNSQQGRAKSSYPKATAQNRRPGTRSNYQQGRRGGSLQVTSFREFPTKCHVYFIPNVSRIKNASSGLSTQTPFVPLF